MYLSSDGVVTLGSIMRKDASDQVPVKRSTHGSHGILESSCDFRLRKTCLCLE